MTKNRTEKVVLPKRQHTVLSFSTSSLALWVCRPLQELTAEPNLIHWSAIRDGAERLWTPAQERQRSFPYCNLIDAIKKCLGGEDSDTLAQRPTRLRTFSSVVIQHHQLSSTTRDVKETKPHKRKQWICTAVVTQPALTCSVSCF